jgi:hypothetical protein
MTCNPIRQRKESSWKSPFGEPRVIYNDIATRILSAGPRNRCSIPGIGKRFFCSRLSDLHPLSILLGVKVARAWSWHSPLCSSEVNNAWRHASIFVLVWCFFDFWEVICGIVNRIDVTGAPWSPWRSCALAVLNFGLYYHGIYWKKISNVIVFILV